MVAPPATLSARRLRKTLSPLITDAVNDSRADRYRKRFPAFAHVWMLLLHTMGANDSLRQSHAQQASDAGLRRRLGMEKQWISFSQLARSSTSRPSECFERLLASTVAYAKCRSAKRRGPLPRFMAKTAALDSTFFSLSGKLSPWSRHKGYTPGVRVQTELDLTRMVPSMGLTTSETSDRTAIKEWDLSQLHGWTLVFDLGYYAHAHFQRLRESGVSFITRLQSQAAYEKVSEEASPVGATTPEGDTVLSDETITLGSPDNRTGAVLHGVRLVTSETKKGETHRLITDRHDLTAAEVIRLYRKRWQIELFFRFIKRQLKTLHAFGTSREAVWLTILVAAIVAIMAMLTEERRPKAITRVSWLRALCVSFTMLRLSG